MKIHQVSAVLILAASSVVFAGTEADQGIEACARASYNFHTVLRDQVVLTADHGAVTLSGTVQGDDQKALAEDTVVDLPGVTRVSNRIQVAPAGPARSDATIAAELRHLLLVRAHVSASSTQVEVSDGVVTLRGTAEDAAQLDITEVYAMGIEGVRSVRNEMVVGSGGPAAAANGIDDISITGQLKYALLSHKATSALKTKIATENGTVIIIGSAGSDLEKEFVTKLAESVPGVRSVENILTVRNPALKPRGFTSLP
jgi:hyperosmotically inducible protein